MGRSLILAGCLTLMLAGTAAWAQVADADCFSGSCGGTSGIPVCPKGSREIGFITYANSKANETRDCETVVSCTNFGHSAAVIDVRFYTGFFPIPAGGGPEDALCSAVTPDTEPGDTTELATDADEDFRAGGIFGAAGGGCPTFEGKGLICTRGGNPKKIVCEAHLTCGNGAVLEDITVVRRP